MFKLLKLLRLFRLSMIFTRFEKSFVVSHSISSVVKFFVFIVFIAHWFACLFFYVSALTDAPDRWISQSEWRSGLCNPAPHSPRSRTSLAHVVQPRRPQSLGRTSRMSRSRTGTWRRFTGV